MSQGNTKTIAMLARKYDLSMRTLRFYEERGLLDPLRVGLTRLYGPRDETKLQVILKAKRMGFSITEIGEIIARHDQSPPDADFGSLHLGPGLIEERIDALSKQKQSVTQAIEELQAALVRMETEPAAAREGAHVP